MRISDWSSDVCSSDLGVPNCVAHQPVRDWLWSRPVKKARRLGSRRRASPSQPAARARASSHSISLNSPLPRSPTRSRGLDRRSEEHTSELQSLMRISYAVFCLKKKKQRTAAHLTHTYL